MSALRDCCELKVQGYRIFSVTDEEHFLPSECRATGFMRDILLPCIPVKRNGRRELFYLTEGLRTLEEIIPEAGEKERQELLQETANKTRSVLECSDFREGELVLDIDHVFLDQEGRVRLLFLPVSSETGKVPQAAALRRMRDELLDVSSGVLSGASAEGAAPDGSDRQALPAEGSGDAGREETPPVRRNERPVLYLTERGSGRMIRVAAHNLTLGRRSEDPEGRLDDTTSISRQHCGILYANGVYSVVDLQSTNGTGVNGRRIQPLIHVQLMNGDILKVVNHEFLVTIRVEDMGL